MVDTLDPQAVEQHAQSVVDQGGSIDAAFNLTSRGDVQGTRLLEMHVDDFLRPTLPPSRLWVTWRPR